MWLRLPLLACTALLAAPAMADDFQQWTSWSVGKALGSWEATLDGTFYTVDDLGHPGDIEVRGLLMKRVGRGVKLGGGYTWVKARPLNGFNGTEHRIVEQLNADLATGSWGSLASRTRLEQRFLPGGDRPGHRLRQQLRYSIAAGPGAAAKLVLQSELYMLLNDAGVGPGAGINQLRSAAGVQLPLADGFTIEPAYLNQTIFQGNRRTNHVFALSLALRL